MKTMCGTMLAAVALAAAAVEGGPRVELPLGGGWSGRAIGDDGTVRSDCDITLPHNWDDYYGHRQMFHGDLHGTATTTAWSMSQGVLESVSSSSSTARGRS